MKIPVSLLDLNRVSHIDLGAYTVLVLADGLFDDKFDGMHPELGAILQMWVDKGGRLISMQRAAEWVAREGIVSAEFPVEEVPFEVPWVHYGDREVVKDSREIAGAIFDAELDRSHPISFGVGNRAALFKTR